MMKCLPGIVLLLAAGTHSPAQNYYAVQGSSYAGSLGVGNNPASIVNTPYAWDINLFSFQEKHTTNAVTIYKYSLLSSPAASEYLFNAGNYARDAHINFNVNLLNGRFALDRQRAFAFGINVRGYGSIKTGPYNFIDTLTGSRDFFALGNTTVRLRGDFVGSSWIEVFGAYSQTLWDRPADRLNAGITLKVSRGLAGAHAAVRDAHAQRVSHGNQQFYEYTEGSASYGYSANLDRWQDNKNTTENVQDFISAADGGFAVDLGVEYLIKSQEILAWDEPDNYYDYDWKIGISLLDLGFNQYRYGMHSRTVSGIQPDMSDTLVDEKWQGVDDLESFNDSLATVVTTMRNLQGKFTVANPARLVINADRYLFDAFYVNADLSINLSSITGSDFRLTEVNLLTLTPRWETRRLGFFLPVMINTEGRVWIGGAFKLGPLLLGIHNWGNVFAKNRMQNGGGYLALVIRPGKKMDREKRIQQYECPEF